MIKPPGKPEPSIFLANQPKRTPMAPNLLPGYGSNIGAKPAKPLRSKMLPERVPKQLAQPLCARDLVIEASKGGGLETAQLQRGPLEKQNRRTALIRDPASKPRKNSARPQSPGLLKRDPTRVTPRVLQNHGCYIGGRGSSLKYKTIYVRQPNPMSEHTCRT